MTTTPNQSAKSSTLPTDLKAEQALGLIGLGLMQKMIKEGSSEWSWSEGEDGGRADLLALRQRLELTDLAIKTSAPLTTAEVTQLLGARPGSANTERGGLRARRISRNVWKLTRSDSQEEKANEGFRSDGFRRRL